MARPAWIGAISGVEGPASVSEVAGGFHSVVSVARPAPWAGIDAGLSRTPSRTPTRPPAGGLAERIHQVFMWPACQLQSSACLPSM